MKKDHLPEPGGPRAGALSLRLTQREVTMLRYIAAHSNTSQHQFVLDAIVPAIEAEYQRLVTASKA